MRGTVLTDASFDHSNGAGGWAAWVRLDDLPLPVKGHGTFKTPPVNSTEAEVMAALNGLWLASARGGRDLLIRSDCMAVQDLVKGKVKAEYLNQIWANALNSPWAVGVRIRSQHVKAHGDHNRSKAAWVNNWADVHARKGLHASRKGRKLLRIDQGWGKDERR